MSQNHVRTTVTLLGTWPDVWQGEVVKGLVPYMPLSVRYQFATADEVTLHSCLLGEGLVELCFVSPCTWNTMVRMSVQEIDGETLLLIALLPWADDDPDEDGILCSLIVPKEGWGFTPKFEAWN